MSYDVIGDIHGQAEKLEALLKKLGYQNTGGSWRHANRTALFVGDFIDRGPHQLKVVNIVRRMIDAGRAASVMGNHEFNAIAWHTPDPDQPGEFLRPRLAAPWGAKNRHQHERFLAEIEHDAEKHADVISWFKTLPLWIDLPELRVVHACWHQPFMDWLAPQLTQSRFLNDEVFASATREPKNEAEKDNATPSIFKAVEALTKGIEIPLPPGHSFKDKDGIERYRVRVRWWDSEADTYQKAAMLPDEIRARLPEIEIPRHARVATQTEKPIFFGHYWLTGKPMALSDTSACVDYSAGKGGPLVAYRWNGEIALNADGFVATE